MYVSINYEYNISFDVINLWNSDFDQSKTIVGFGGNLFGGYRIGGLGNTSILG